MLQASQIPPTPLATTGLRQGAPHRVHANRIAKRGYLRGQPGFLCPSAFQTPLPEAFTRGHP
jgi:hypothetical protein